MSYSGSPTTIFAWTDMSQRDPFEYVVTPYYNGSGYSGGSGTGPYLTATTVYSEKDMETVFAYFRDLAQTKKVVDQVTVTKAPIVVPSVQES